MSKKTKNKRKKFYGMVKIRTGEKLAWISSQNKNGWSLGLALNTKTIWLRNVRFSSVKEVERALDAGVVFVELKDSVAKK